MGRYFANGVATTIIIRNKKSSIFEKIDLKLNKKRILNQINKYLSIKDYRISFDKDIILLRIKKDIFNKNIHSLLKEIDSLTDCNDYLSHYLFNKKINVNSCDFNPDNYKIILQKSKEDGSYYINAHNIITEDMCGAYTCNSWIFWDDYKLRNTLRADIGAILLWFDSEKYIGEDESKILSILNTLKTRYYKTPLSKDMIFYISG